MITDHRLQDEVLQSGFREHAVARRLSAVGRLRLGSPDVRRPPDAGQQAGRPAHRVVAWTGHLLVPRLCRAASDQHGDYPDGAHEFGEHLHVEQLMLGPSILNDWWSSLSPLFARILVVGVYL